MSGRTFGDAFFEGLELGGRLQPATDLLFEIALAAPESMRNYTTSIPAELIGKARELIELAGVDWKKLHRDIAKRRREASKAEAERRRAEYEATRGGAS